MYCIRAASEAVPLGEEVHLPIIFSPTVFERLPPGPNQEVSDLALRLIGTLSLHGKLDVPVQHLTPEFPRIVRRMVQVSSNQCHLCFELRGYRNRHAVFIIAWCEGS